MPFVSINPATGETLRTYRSHRRSEVAAALAAWNHPIGSSSTSAPSDLKAGQEEPAAADASAASDAAAASYDAATEPVAALESHEEAPAEVERRSRTRPSAADRDQEAPESVLTALSKAYGLGMNWEQADRELAEFLLNEYPSQCRWSYSPEQRAALLAWRRISGRGRYRPARS